MRSSPRSRACQGLAALAAILLLLGTALVAVAFASRSLIAEQQAASAQLRSGLAFEAAQAGLDWAVLQLNRPVPTDATCVPTSPGSGETLRSRLLAEDADTGAVVPIPRPGSIGCNLGAAGAWACDCAGAAVSSLPHPGAEAMPGFRVVLAATARPGVVALTATGCADVHAGCPTGEGIARTSVLLVQLPGLRSAPAAPLLVTGNLRFGGDVTVGNLDPSGGGLLAAAGGSIAGAPSASAVPAGTPADSTVRGGHASLRAPASDRLFQRHLGLDPVRWAALPSVAAVECGAGDCSAAFAMAHAQGARLLRIEGPFDIDASAGPVQLGSPSQPVVVVSAGTARWRGAVQLFGVLVAPGIDWSAGGTLRGSVRGAVVVSGDAALVAPADLRYDSELLGRLSRLGTLVPLGGSWRDF